MSEESKDIRVDGRSILRELYSEISEIESEYIALWHRHGQALAFYNTLKWLPYNSREFARGVDDLKHLLESA